MKNYKFILFILSLFIFLFLLNGCSNKTPINPPTNPQTNPPSNGQLAFPGAEGFGRFSLGGRGGTIYKVTSLADSGPGTLRECIEASGSRVCIFETSGVISLNSNLDIKNPYLTIAGQTAPSPGIFVRYYDIVAKTNDVIIQHVSVGPGDYNEGTGKTLYTDADGMAVHGGLAYNVIMDHVTILFGIDQVGSIYLNAYGAPHDVTISNSISAYPLDNSIHYEGHPHAKGIIVGPGSERISIIKNIIAHSNDRNPKITGTSYGEVINNVIYNWGNDALEFGQGKPVFANSKIDDQFKNVPVIGAGVGNVFISGINKNDDRPISIDSPTSKTSSFYLADNMLDGNIPSDPWSTTIFDDIGSTITEATSFTWGSGANIFSSSQVQSYVLTNAGSRPLDRHESSQRVIDDITSKTGQIIDCITPSTCSNSFGGWPVYAQSTRTLTVPSNPSGDDDGDGYTNLEEWLYTYSQEVE